MDPSQTIDLKPLYTAAQVQEQIDRLVEQIVSEWYGEELIVIGLLKGCFMFLSDMARKMHKNTFLFFQIPARTSFYLPCLKVDEIIYSCEHNHSNEKGV